MKWSLSELAVWALRGHLCDRLLDMLSPLSFEPPGTEKEFTRSWQTIEGLLEPGGAHILQSGMTAGALARRESLPEWFIPLLERRVSLAGLGLPFSWRQLIQGQWKAFPLALVARDRAQLFWAMMGMLEGSGVSVHWPRWWDEVADAGARDAVSVAMDGLESRFGAGFFFWPLLPAVHTPLVFGPSLALPVYLAGWSLTRKSLGSGILCTGAITPHLSIFPVGHLREKARLAREKGFAAILWPRSEERVTFQEEGVEILEAENLDHACFLWERYSPGSGKDIDHQFHCLSDARRLAANVHLLDKGVICWEGFDGLYRLTLDELLASRTLMEQFVGNLESIMDDPAGSGEQLDRLMAPIDTDVVREIAACHPPTALRLAQMQLTLANHRGRIVEGGLWVRISDEMAPAASRYAKGLQLRAEYANRAFIHHRHNRYDFRPDLPDHLMETLMDLEGYHDIKLRSCPGCVTPELAKLYGTIAQNFGFCGPSYMADLRRWAHMAQDAFGKGMIAEYEEDWRRQFCYVLYGLMDAGEWQGAREMLPIYLRTDPKEMGEQDIEGLNPYRHGALARFVAETGTEVSLYEAWMCEHLEDRPCRHPWQLWLLNAGIYLRDPRKRELALKRSVFYCLEMGPTAQAMGLMPLAFLWREKLQPLDWIADWTRTILEAIKREYGKEPHFQQLIHCPSWEEALSKVLRNRNRLFPFTYR